ncbi:MAG: alkene reductase, partial [Neisseriaceae bacterium]|nr:alkene reductase [Neisseriaceae bacterium]
ALTEYLAKRLNDFDLAFVHLMRSDFFQAQSGDIMPMMRAHYKGILIGNMGYSADEAAIAIGEHKLDAVSFGTKFLANPDLPERFKAGAALNKADDHTFYTPGAKGYTDYPTMDAN